MANTLTNMQSRIFAEEAVTVTNAIMTNVAGFTLGLNKEAGQKGDVVRVPIIDTVEAGDFDADGNNYAAGDHTDEGVDIPVSRHKVAKCGYTDTEFLESPVDYWKKKGGQCVRGLGKAVVKDVFGLIDGTFTKKDTVALAEFGVDKVTAFVTLAEDNDIDPAEATLTLQGVYFSRLLAGLDTAKFGGDEAIRKGVIPELFGFRQIVRAPLLKAAKPDLAGFISLPQSIGLGFRYCEPQSKKIYEEVGQAYDDATGVLYGVRRFGEAATGRNHLAVEALYGAKAVDKKALIRLLAA
jgi:hypothetical protein